MSGFRLAVPTALTLGNAACGFLALLALQHGVALPFDPAWLVFGGWFFDMIDGSVAKALGAQSAFGAQLDSLCDAVSFGVVPGLLLAAVAGPWGMAAGFIYLAAVLVRLARFNVQQAEAPDDHMYFSGLSSPAGAMMLAAAVLAGNWQLAYGGAPWLAPAQAGLAVAVALLMVSRVRYADLPKHLMRGGRAWWTLVPALAAVLIWPLPVAIFVLAAAYVVGGALANFRKPA